LLKVKIAVLVSGGGTNLQALIDAQNAGKIPHGEIALVVADRPGAYALERAEKAGIPHAELLKRELKADFEPTLMRLLEENGIELIVLAGCLTIFTEAFTARYANRIINIHPALIPSFCGKGYYGLKVHEAALAAGVKVTGATVHYVNEIPDGGAIILQKAVNIHPGDTPETLQRRVMEKAEWILLPRAAELVCKKIISER